MKNKYSVLSLWFLLFAFIGYRFVYITNNPINGYNATSWDAFGYYMYLPSTFIYGDVKELKWVPGIDSTYHVTGGTPYQMMKLKPGTYTNKYLSGVAILQTPWFFVGHISAGL